MSDLKMSTAQEERVLKFVDELQRLADEIGITVYVPKGNPMVLVDIEKQQLIKINITHEEEEVCTEKKEDDNIPGQMTIGDFIPDVKI